MTQNHVPLPALPAATGPGPSGAASPLPVPSGPIRVRTFPATARREHETRLLLTRAREGGISRADAEELRSRAVQVNELLAVAVTRRYRRKDLRSAALRGLRRAVDWWDPAGATSFAPFAARAIDAEIRLALSEAQTSHDRQRQGSTVLTVVPT